MTWYLFALLAVLAESLETIIDKLLVIDREKTLDPLIASFYRNATFFAFIILSGVLGVFGELRIFITAPIIILGGVWICNSLIYDYLLRNAEITRFTSVTYIFPILLLYVDIVFFGQEFTVPQIGFILLLLAGAFLISFQKTIAGIRSVFSKRIWVFLFTKFVIFAAAFTLFKWYNQAYGITGLNFYFNTWIFVILTYLVVIVAQQKESLLVPTAAKNQFLKKTAVAKFFDFLSSVFILKAVSSGSITATKSLQALVPLTLLTFSSAIQRRGFRLKEDFSRVAVHHKVAGIICILAGSIGVILA